MAIAPRDALRSEEETSGRSRWTLRHQLPTIKTNHQDEEISTGAMRGTRRLHGIRGRDETRERRQHDFRPCHREGHGRKHTLCHGAHCGHGTGHGNERRRAVLPDRTAGRYVQTACLVRGIQDAREGSERTQGLYRRGALPDGGRKLPDGRSGGVRQPQRGKPQGCPRGGERDECQAV